ncbi:MAG: hypothetical protein KJ886_06265 [Candidatus Thermoplasmatota archaeon]|nr:hypothetical protein [Candidatus Thermoplasmatota archaeon]MBU4190572.1 hypothetical protein [Candidatus Thermoplasmatota archaeon]MBU4256584.1 hypothetical protein [Candidatus Thermoplasmatota archaeon]MCG2826627.1 hypothetical protein [Thermoplasmatales archaeon]
MVKTKLKERQSEKWYERLGEKLGENEKKIIEQISEEWEVMKLEEVTIVTEGGMS